MKIRWAVLFVLFSSLASFAGAADVTLQIDFNQLTGGAGEIKIKDGSGTGHPPCNQITQAQCTITVPAGTTVALAATPLGGGVFGGWGVGGGSASVCLGANTNIPSCKFVISQNSTLRAAFSPSSQRKAMVVFFAGNSGSANVIARIPGGETKMSCPNLPTTCKKELFVGSLLELVAISQSGGTAFTGWSNASGATTVCAQNPTSPVCKFFFSGDSEVTATFTGN